jgi:hypothetical protein
MLTLGSTLGFAAPLALVGLLALPIVWLLLRAAPPSPKRRVFAPFRLLLGLSSDEETQERTPWWLILLRLALATLVILALARPVLFPTPPPPGTGPILLVIDDGWASAAQWEHVRDQAQARIEAAGRDGREVIPLFTAPRPGAVEPPERMPAREAARQLAAHAPSPWPTDRAAAAQRIETARRAGEIPAQATPEWLSDGLDDGGALALGRTLAGLGAGRVTEPASGNAPLALDPPRIDGDGFVARVRRAISGVERDGALVVLDGQGRSLGRAPFTFAAEAAEAEARATLPVELRNEARSVGIEGERSAGATQVLDDRWRRAMVGLAATAADEDRQPLLADLHYVETALNPVATIRRASLSELLDQSSGPAVGAIVLTDAGKIVGSDAERLTEWVENGGLLIRFAGPRLAARADDLVPVQLRSGDRSLGGAMAWDEPQKLAPFDADSPFFGLQISDETTVGRQVLAVPTPDLSERTWARLADGTPLVTSARRGQGRIVLFHITAAPEWSDLPLSGLFAEMLSRTLAYADARPTTQQTETGDWRLESALDAGGRLVAPPPELGPVTAEDFAMAHASPKTPPGIWTRPGAARAVNVIAANDPVAPLPTLPSALERVSQNGRTAHALAGPLLGLSLLFFALDGIAVAALAGLFRMPQLRRRTASAAAVFLTAGVALAGALLAPHAAHAQDVPRDAPRAAPRAAPRETPPVASPQGNAAKPAQSAAKADPKAAPATGRGKIDDGWALKALSTLHLAYVRTGNAEIDRMSDAGLKGLSMVLNQRTTVEPAEPIAVDIEHDPFELLPMLYWPVTPDTQAPSPETAARIDAYLKSGGVIVFDTQDAGSSAVYGEAPNPGLSRLVEAIDVPPLERVPTDHVMTKSFYLIQDFPGRWSSAPLWVVAHSEEASLDGVSSVIVTSADWAAAWAVDDNGRSVAAVTPGGEDQREHARRAGVNLIMYILTGNYKGDLVHMNAILDRLGQ